ncbi:zinc-binding alcohol dehydrogenase family protein [Corallincola luteus]|uniref:Zinc-type alcohol dehydrogenase-like protein n=1 Tax=Corallincola luteus TaxID=1775177 RepID=A0ABY2AHQ7_9GAMM|nr:zinc-binding alcohol dehydrogenase family protein [Corallincola luteus]TCI02162.1 zinc-binding alcohol dehydrogenase family protein [Corallincola luteus]
MKAIGYQQNLPISDALSLQDIELPEPHAKGHDLLVEVQAVSVNPVDTKIRQGVPAADGQWKVVGWDATGIVKAVGANVTLFKPGDKVWYAGDISRSGSNAELQLVDERIVGHMPESLGFADAAALPLTSITAWEMLFDRLQVEVGKAASKKSIMIIGAAGGVGSIMVQLAARLTNLTIIGTASRPETSAWLKELGAHHVLDHSKPLSQELKYAGLPLVDYVVSLNNTESHYAEIIDSLIPQGKFGLIDDPESLNAVPLKNKAISLHWELMFTRSLFQTEDMQSQHDLLNQVAALIDSGLIKSTVGQHFGQINATNLKRAHAVLETQTAKGKIVLEGF